jgi:hypothetical protein
MKTTDNLLFLMLGDIHGRGAADGGVTIFPDAQHLLMPAYRPF